MVKTIQLEACRINVRGVVQGVGFRPFIYNLAIQNQLRGFVLNTSGDVTITVEGDSGQIELLLKSLRENPPPQARIESITTAPARVEGFSRFEIRNSLGQEGQYQLISPDLATCPACAAEIVDPSDRRYHYPFTNCTNCGPRFTIIEDIPYDRPLTTMRNFTMCPECRKEYEDPGNRRFHAQPNACPRCGPAISLTDPKGSSIFSRDVIADVGGLLREGKIVAVKGLGGFLLACNAADNQAVARLRERKHRPAKPFAVMVKNLEEARRYCLVSAEEEVVLTSAASPIVLLERKPGKTISPGVAPGSNFLGLMLPYTPLHHLLMAEAAVPLIMTSGNFSEEPIAKDNDEALDRLSNIADFFILHNREIHSRYDDSVVSMVDRVPQIIRRARGYAPFPVSLPFSLRPSLACGAELKNTFCLTRDHYAFVSQHIGDMENLETQRHFEGTLRLYTTMFRIKPEIVAVDMHPDYLSSQWGEKEARLKDLPLVRVQHHHAHIASCMADNACRTPVIGIALDGTGYGSDGNIWGGEFMVADYGHFQRKAHFEYLPLPGGDSAIAKPYRIAAGYIYSLLGKPALDMALPCFAGVDRQEIELIQRQIDGRTNSPLTSSCGRLFDAVSALLGVCLRVEYEGQAAVELETTAGKVVSNHLYPFSIEAKDGLKIIRIGKMFSAIIEEIRNGQPAPEIAAAFHDTIARIVAQMSLQFSEELGIKTVALSGGVFQNRRLLSRVYADLKKEGLTPMIHKQVPCNDGGISLGQALVANAQS